MWQLSKCCKCLSRKHYHEMRCYTFLKHGKFLDVVKISNFWVDFFNDLNLQLIEKFFKKPKYFSLTKNQLHTLQLGTKNAAKCRSALNVKIFTSNRERRFWKYLKDMEWVRKINLFRAFSGFRSENIVHEIECHRMKFLASPSISPHHSQNSAVWWLGGKWNGW